MVKDSEENLNKKRRKVDSSPGKTTKKPATESLTVYERVMNFEECEVAKRLPEVDLKLYGETCSKFAQIIKELDEIKTKKNKGWEEDVKEKRIEASLLTVLLKKLNRLEKIRTKSTRENLNKVKQQVDAYQLQLQNLRCEIIHLRKEVDKCLHFKSKDLGIDLVPLEQFYKEAPESISRPEVTKVDEHQRHLARLEWELKQRKELSLLCEQLESNQQNVASQIRKKKSDLDNLAPLIKDVLAVTKPLQENLGLSSFQSSSKNEIVELLPHPLYFLYVQADAYREACDKKLTVSVCGDEEEAKVIKHNFTEVSSNEDSDSDGPEEDKRRHRKKKHGDRKEEKQRELLTKHPLCVEIKVLFKGGDKVTLKFFYLINLHILTVVPSLELHQPLTSISAHQLLSNSSLLSELFPGDSGLDSPNIANYYQLRQAGLDKFDNEKLGTPYIWVQRMGGLDFAGNKAKKIVAVREIAQTSIPLVLKEIRRRIKSRTALASQVILLENGTINGPESMSSVKLSSDLRNWQTLTWAEYIKYDTSKLVESNFISENDIFFKAIIIRGHAKLILLIAIKPSYPFSSPVLTLQLDWNGKTYTSTKNTNIRDIEREVNVHWKELLSSGGWGNSLLSYQVHRTMVCLDIMLECESPQEFNVEKKTFFHPYRGRTRSHPYKFLPIGEGVFTQR